MNENEVKELRSKTVSEITDLIPAMDRADLVSVLAAEADDAQPRVSLTRALAQAIEDIDAEQNPPRGDDAAPEAPTTADEAAAWQAPDYNGPLDIAQADWRNRNIKPVGEVITK